MAEHGSAVASLRALPGIARDAGVEDYASCPESVAAAELKAGRKSGAKLIRYDSPEYPELLRQLSDAPPLLWVRGNPKALAQPKLAVIGARNASSLGLRMARGMANALSEMGICIVSGLARGIDSAAHEASVKHGTIAVMAGGTDCIYPAENRILAATICDRGCLVSEQPPGLEPIARHFPVRNRIISGLSHGVIVIEAASGSGSLITARNALDQGREVLAVPGHPVDGRAGGCNQLIRDGAVLVRNAEDVLEALPDLKARMTSPARQKDEKPQSAETPARCSEKSSPSKESCMARVLDRLSPSPTEENALIRDIGIPASVLAPAIVELELTGRLIRMPGGMIALSDASSRASRH
ncbi:DNA-processing protein DprA [Paracoccus aerodenitrificans]|nr:DNA-processing protein DprA [Paracoccus aerodenitrificans]WBU63219.1 DNA-processing protein DprA [Paracoccus aerodenitrificans]